MPPSEIRGRRESRARDAPAALCANEKAHKRSHHRFAGNTQPSLRDGFNKLPRALPGDQVLLTPSLDGQESARLTPTSRRQDHTTWPSASAPFVKGASASTASRPTYRDDREPPPWKERDGISYNPKSGSRQARFCNSEK